MSVAKYRWRGFHCSTLWRELESFWCLWHRSNRVSVGGKTYKYYYCRRKDTLIKIWKGKCCQKYIYLTILDIRMHFFVTELKSKLKIHRGWMSIKKVFRPIFLCSFVWQFWHVQFCYIKCTYIFFLFLVFAVFNLW